MGYKWKCLYLRGVWKSFSSLKPCITILILNTLMEQIIEKPYVIGLDMGGTNSVFGIVDQRGTIKSQTAIKTQAYPDVKDYVKAAVEALQPALDVVGGIDYIKGMGIGAPNGNFYTGNIEYAANLVWEGVVPIAQMFEDALGVPCRVTNDANAAAMGEMTYGVARGMKNFIMITLGTGVGSGIVVDGKIVYGSDGFAGELGHFVVDHTPAGRKCGCGRSGCLETYCSATGVARTAREILEKSDARSLLREMNRNLRIYGSYAWHRLCRLHYVQHARSLRILRWSDQGWRLPDESSPQGLRRKCAQPLQGQRQAPHLFAQW